MEYLHDSEEAIIKAAREKIHEVDGTIYEDIEDAIIEAKEEHVYWSTRYGGDGEGAMPGRISVQVYKDSRDNIYYQVRFDSNCGLTDWTDRAHKGGDVIDDAYNNLELDLSNWDDDWTLRIE